MKVEVLAIGDELLIGQTINTHIQQPKISDKILPRYAVYRIGWLRQRPTKVYYLVSRRTLYFSLAKNNIIGNYK